MFRRVFVILLCVLMASIVFVGAETAEEIVTKNLDAKGGEDAWRAVQTATMNGTMRMSGGAAGALEAPFSVEFKRPEKIRLEFTMQGMTAIQAFDGKAGWAILPFLGKTEPEKMAEDRIEELKNQADFEGVLVNYKEKGHTVEFMGIEEIDGTPAYKLKVTKASGDVDVMYLDEEHFVEFKIESQREIQGNQVSVTTVLGDYKEVGGLLFAHSMEMSYGGGEAQQVITIESIKLDAEISDERFAMPVKKTPDTQTGS